MLGTFFHCCRGSEGPWQPPGLPGYTRGGLWELLTTWPLLGADAHSSQVLVSSPHLNGLKLPFMSDFPPSPVSGVFVPLPVKMVLLSPSLSWNCVRAESILESLIFCPHHPRTVHRCVPHAQLPESWISWFAGSMPSFLFFDGCWHSPGHLCWLVLFQYDIS